MRDLLAVAGIAAVGGYVGCLVVGYDSDVALRTGALCALFTAAIVGLIKLLGR